jgi:Mn2+/Fe2+ NRAMP family transporter
MDQPRPKPTTETDDPGQHRPGGGLLHALGTGVITGAADDDPSAIGTYASAGAKFGLGFPWIAPAVQPMMYVVVYISAKLGQVYGKGLFAIVRDRYPRWILYPLVLGAFSGNVIEAAANLGGIGAAYDLVQGFGREGSLHARPSEAKLFYGTIAAVTALAAGLNFLGFNPMRALVWSGIVQGFSVPPLLLLMMLMTNDRAVMGGRVNSRVTNGLGWITTAVTFLATACLVVTWFL